MEGDALYLDIIDSQEYLEFGWYFANLVIQMPKRHQHQPCQKSLYCGGRVDGQGRTEAG